MSKKQLSVCIFVVILLVIMLLVLFLKKSKKPEGFCNCLGMSYQTCADPATLQYLYKTGMTENDIPQNGYNGRVSMPYDAVMPLLNSLPSRTGCK
jgi:hypothetical protein